MATDESLREASPRGCDIGKHFVFKEGNLRGCVFRLESMTTTILTIKFALSGKVIMITGSQWTEWKPQER